MARIDASCDLVLALTVFSVQGSVTADDFVAAVRSNYSKHPTSNAIWDFTHCELSNIDTKALIKMSDVAKEFAEKRPDPRTVFVVDDKQERPILKLYEDLLEMCGSQIECLMVPTLEEAYEKLALEPPPKRDAATPTR
jgi:23S rRNA U2552 (ribose-2'-O)-methylase RlmE/FtsJ